MAGYYCVWWGDEEIGCRLWEALDEMEVDVFGVLGMR